MTRGKGAKLTKSIVFNTEADANLLAWIEEQRGTFTLIVRTALYAAMENEVAGQQNEPAGDFLDAIRETIREELGGLQIVSAGSAPPDPKPFVEDGEINQMMKAQLLGAF
jgi:hypothetical protein